MLVAKNRRAYYDFQILEKFLAGISLTGYEVKAIREGKVNFEGAFIFIRSGEAFLKNLYVGMYSKIGVKISEEDLSRDRKLLLNKYEIEHIQKETGQKGKSAIPLAFILKNNYIKLELGIVKGKKLFEKKQVAKDRQVIKDLEKEAREYKNQ